MIWKSSADGRVSEIYGLPEAGASYKLNLRNYGSNYIGIRTITGASTISAYLDRLISLILYVRQGHFCLINYLTIKLS